ncbi:MAG: cupin domain-containing protein [Alphaproteobacteria bacterium]
MMSFAELVAPLSAEDFLKDYYGRKPVHIARGADCGPDILNWERLNGLLALSPYWTQHHLKLIMKGREALPQNYCDRVETATGPAMMANPKKVKAMLGMGASLVANRVHAICPEVARVAQIFEERFAAQVGANVYCSFKDVQAFTTHFDLHDVFAYQTEGRKTWRIYSARADNPTHPLPPGDETEKLLASSRGDLLFEATLEPGDLLYLPRGQYHDALATSEASLHVTFSVSPATGMSLFDLIKGQSDQDTLFRAYLPDARHDGGEALRAHLQALADKLSALVTSPLFEAEVAALQHGLRRDLPDFTLPETPRPTFYTVHRRARIERTLDDGYRLITDGATIPLGAAHAAVGWAMGQRWFTREDLEARYADIAPAALDRVLDAMAHAGLIAKAQPAQQSAPIR